MIELALLISIESNILMIRKNKLTHASHSTFISISNWEDFDHSFIRFNIFVRFSVYFTNIVFD